MAISVASTATVASVFASNASAVFPPRQALGHDPRADDAGREQQCTERLGENLRSSSQATSSEALDLPISTRRC